MLQINPEIANLFPQSDQTSDCNPENSGHRKIHLRRPIVALSVFAMTAIVVLFSLSVKRLSLSPTVAAQTRNSAAAAPANSAAASQLPEIEMQSPVLASVQAAVDDLRKQAPSPAAANSSSRANGSSQAANSVGLFQGGNCVDPHPGSPQQSQQQVDPCHAQLWYKWADGCTGYRLVPSTSGGGGGNCSNSQPASDRITWTFCAAKHTP